MKNILLFKKPSRLLFWSFALLFSLTSHLGWGQTSIFSYTNTTASYTSTGWTGTNNVATNTIDRSSFLLLDAGSPGDFITTGNYDLSNYSYVVLNVQVATFDTGSNPSLKVEVSSATGTTFTSVASYTSSATPTSSSYIAGGPIVIPAPSGGFTSTTKFKFSNTITSGRGLRIQSLNMVAPTQATNVTFSNVTTTGLTFNWTDGSNGSSGRRAIFVSEASTGSPVPVNGTTYTASTNWNSKGTQIGSTGWYCVYNNTGTHASGVVLTNLLSSTAYRVMVCDYDGLTTTSVYNVATATGNPANSTTSTAVLPVITGSAATSPTSVSSTYGAVSAEASFSVSGTNMATGIVVTPPSTNFEVSTTSGGTFANTVTVGTSGTIASTTVYIRLKNTAPAGSYSGNIVLSSTGGATSVNVPIQSSIVAKATSSITATGAASYTYTGSPQGPASSSVTGSTGAVTYSYSGVSPTVYSASATRPTNVGTYQVIATVATDANYLAADSAPFAFAITKANSSISITGGSATYAHNGVGHGPTQATVTGSTGAVTFAYTGTGATTYGPSATLPTDVGTYQAVATVASDANFNGASSAAFNYSITSEPVPVINSALTATATYGVAATSYFITATNNPASFNATGLPNGLNVNTTTGEISGTATALPGNFNVSITATNDGGTSIAATLVYTVSAKALTLTSAAANSKVYDRTNTAVVTGTLSGIVGGDDVTLNGSGTFDSVNVNTGIHVTSTSTLGGAKAAYYSLTQPTGLTADITAKTLTVTGATVTSRAYNGTNVAAITGATFVAGGVISPDVVTLSGGGTFASVNVATGISVTANLVSTGTGSTNYTFAQPTGLTGNITLAPLTITGVTANNKVYDGTNAATLNTASAAYSGLQNSETFAVTGTPTATFNNATVANGKAVTVSGFTAPSANYSVSQPTGLTANITAATAPALTASTTATVDGPFEITFTDDSLWRSGITSITVGGTTLSAAAYSVVADKIIFTPSLSSPVALLQLSGTKSIVVISTGYSNTSVSQTINAGAPNKLAITTQPTAPATNGAALAAQPVVVIRDQYNNLTSSTATVTAAAVQGTWTLGGTLGVAAVNGTTTFSGLTATSAAAVTGATITFTSAGLTSVTSNTFNIPSPPPANDDCSGAIALLANQPAIQGSNVGSTKSVGVAAPSACTNGNATGSYSSGTLGDVWYKVTAPVSGTVVTVQTSSSGSLTDTAMALYTGTCGSLTQVACDDDGAGSGAFSLVTYTTTEVNATLYVRVWDFANDNVGTFNIQATAVEPVPTISATPSAVPAMTAVVGAASDTETIAISGIHMEGNINVVLTNNAGNNFSVSPSSFTTAGGNLVVTYSPTTAGAHTATVTLSSLNAQDVVLTLNGTATLATPTANAATGILSNGFTAHWDAVAGAQSYVIDVYKVVGGANAADLFISEYVEGSSNNRYIEIFNGTGAAVNLSDYRLRLYSNGASSPGNDIQLSGTLANNSVKIYKHASAALTLPAGVTAEDNAAVNYNGDDALALYKISTAANVDVFGRIGDDPGTAWTGNGGYTTLDKTLRRKSSVMGGVLVSPTGTGVSAFTTLTTQWDLFNVDVVSGLGSHTFDGGSTTTYVVQNQNAGSGTFYQVTGLDSNTEYHYVVRAVSSAVTSSNSNAITVTTALPAPNQPSVIAGSDIVCANSSQTYSVTNDAAATSYSWTLPSGWVGTSTTNSITVTAGSTGGTISVVAVNAGGSSTARDLAVTVNPLQTPVVGLTSSDSDNTFAYGTSVTFTAAASNVSGNTGIVYDFKVNGTSRQSGSSNTFTTTTISDQQQVSVSISVTGGTCMQASTANSNIITNTVSGAVLVYISNFCGQTLPFLTAPINSTTAVVTGNPTVQYQFRVKRVGGASETLALRSTPSFNLTQSTLYAYNASYEVYVAAVINGVLQPESSACIITTPATVPPAAVQTTYCGSTLADAYSAIFAGIVPGATGYRFDVYQGSTHITTVDRTVNYFYLTNMPSWSYNTVYTVYVAVKINNEAFGSFGSVACTVATPQLVTPGLVACGSQMATVSSPVFTTSVPGATNYAFEVSGPGITTTTINRSVPYFYLTGITNWNYATSYTVKVTVTKGSEVGPQSAGCILTTPAIPSTSIRSSQCDQLLSSPATAVFADAVYGAVSYLFNVSDGINAPVTVTRSVNYFYINTIPTWEYNRVYTVTVQAVRNGSTSPAVTTCTVTTPEGPMTTIQNEICNNPSLTKANSLTVDAYPGATSYLFVIEEYNEESVLVHTYTKVSYTNSLVLSSVPNLPTPTSLPGITYAWGVQVAVMGKYGEVTKGCSFTLIPTPSSRMTPVSFSATAYPNPFASNFMLDVKTASQSTVNVKVYDMVGRLIEQRDVKATDLESTSIGSNYPSGVYNVVVSQNENLETVRVIKR